MKIKKVTTNNLSESTEQEVFDFISNHLLTQNKRAISDFSGECQFITSKGLKCAAGCLIPDNILDTIHNHNMDWNSLCITHNLSVRHSDLIQQFQDLHDTNEPKFWRKILEDLASLNNLRWNF